MTQPVPTTVNAYWVSTPRFTCLVETDMAGRIVHSAPYLWRWRGKAWTQLLQFLHRDWRHRGGLMVTPLPATTGEACRP
jgi:hypothetical protein